jgi:PKD repeat protein
MKKIYTVLFIFISLCTFSQTPWCGTEEYFRKQAEKNPELYQLRQEFFSQPQTFVSTDEPGRSAPRIIPIVFHVIHQGGPENISKAQILDQIRILNEDYRRLNTDTGNTPTPFKPLAADCNIEFRLAQIDPNGNCTDGIVRIYSSLTNNADDPVKALSIWPRANYFNVWVVKSIASTPPYITLGYATPPPPFSSAATDGVVVRADYVGSIGTSSPAKAGRVLTHEAGHWLGLQHIWGDATCGDDGINDTPVHQDLNFGCPTFPHTNTCAGNDPVNGEMFTNFMDYTDGNCQNMFSSGQKTQRIDLVLGNALSRAGLVSASNNTATGTDGTPAVLCAPIADFITTTPSVCEGASVTFTNFSYNADTMGFSWQFPGGNPSTSNLANPVVQYAASGIYSVTLTVSNAAGSSTKVRTSYIIVNGAAVFTAPYVNSFESAGDFPHYDGYVLNPDNGNTWQRFISAGSSGTSSIRINNFSGNTMGEMDDYVLPSFNLTYITQPTLTFKYAHAQRSSTSDDGLKVFVSVNCGQTWQQRLYLHGATLATAPITASNFTPTSTQWVQQSVNLLAYAGLPNLRIKFQGISNEGNNVYVDEINLNGIVGIQESGLVANSFVVFPNPSNGNTAVSFDLLHSEIVSWTLTDITGRVINTSNQFELQSGHHNISVGGDLRAGVYFVMLKAGNSITSLKLVVINN